MNESASATGPSLLGRALAALDVGLRYAERVGVRVSVVVLDASFTPVALARMDGSYESTARIAIAKGHTALNFKAATDDLVSRIKPENRAALASVDPQFIFLGGGRPARRDGKVIAAVGVSGGSEEQDAECARLIVESLEA